MDVCIEFQVLKLAQKHGRTPSTIILNWLGALVRHRLYIWISSVAMMNQCMSV